MEKCLQVSLRTRDGKYDLGVDGRTVLRWGFKKEYGKVDWVYLAQDVGKWRVIVKAVNNFRIEQNEGHSQYY